MMAEQVVFGPRRASHRRQIEGDFNPRWAANSREKPPAYGFVKLRPIEGTKIERCPYGTVRTEAQIRAQRLPDSPRLDQLADRRSLRHERDWAVLQIGQRCLRVDAEHVID